MSEVVVVKGGELLFCGSTCWDSVGRRKGLTEGNLVSPTRLRPLVGVDICFVAAGCASCHCVALDTEGRCYTWGRNEKGQLGHGDNITRDRPTVVSELSKYKIIRAAAGKNHTVVVTDDGQSFAFGWNKHGQLGIGSVKNETELSPVRCAVTEVNSVACGADFTVWLTSVEGASILTAGLPQYGQLGHATDNEYNTKDSSVRLAYEAQPRPRPIAAFSGETIVKVACGTNHTVAVDKSGYVYTWGFGGYGRLGHREQKDEFAPRRVDVFTRQNVLPPDAIVSAGSASSSCTAGGGQLYMWGKIKSTGDDSMYPKPLLDLSGWNLRCMDSGYMHHFVGADSSCISWGLAQCGELGYGPHGQKSSAVPKKVDILDGMHVISVACGFAHSMVVIDRTNVEDRLEQLDVYDGKASEEVGAEPVSESPASKKTTKKASAKAPAKSNKRKKSKDASESEDEEEENSDDESDDYEEQSNGRAKSSGRGRGKAAGKATAAKKGAGRGRGRSPAANKSSPPEVKVSTGKRGRPRKS
uniref:Protein RCC2 homolog n=1 Tax=Solanum lycopersicum TaxID=4081 RepID=A0A3Q7G7W1_SOLLC|nr:protein RCC2 [Solanum lycopersicum]